MGFEPTISTVTGWHVRPLHHGAVARNHAMSSYRLRAEPVNLHSGSLSLVRLALRVSLPQADGGRPLRWLQKVSPVTAPKRPMTCRSHTRAAYSTAVAIFSARADELPASLSTKVLMLTNSRMPNSDNSRP